MYLSHYIFCNSTFHQRQSTVLGLTRAFQTFYIFLICFRSAMDALKDHLSGAQAILRARHMVSRPYERSLVHINMASHQADNVDATIRRMAGDVTTLRRKLAASESSLAFLRRQRTSTTPVSILSTSVAYTDTIHFIVLYKKNLHSLNVWSVV